MKTATILLATLACVSVTAEAARIRVMVSPAAAGHDVCAYLQTDGAFTSAPIVGQTDDQGIFQTGTVDSGTYFVIASSSGGVGGVSRVFARSTGMGQGIFSEVSVNLDQHGLRCTGQPVIELAAFGNQQQPSDIGPVGVAWKSTPVLDAPVEYCVLPAQQDGSCAACPNDGWATAGNRGDGLNPLLSGSVDIPVPGKRTYCLVERVFGGLSNVVTADVRTGFRIGELLIDNGRQLVGNSQVSLRWSSNLSIALETQYRASEDPDFEGASWSDVQPIDGDPGVFVVPSFSLSGGRGPRTVYLQMRLDGQNATATNVITDQVVVVPPVTVRQEYVLPAGPLFEFASANGWDFSITGFGNSACSTPERDGDNLLVGTGPSNVCGYDLFAGRSLNDGWRFVDFDMTVSPAQATDNFTCQGNVIAAPEEGGSSARLMIHVLALLPDSLFPLAAPNFCKVAITSVTVRGPEGADAQEEAFAEID